jgi:hypothetical protein
VVSRVSLDAMTRKNTPFPFRESNHGRPAHNLVTILTELPRLCVQASSFINLSATCGFIMTQYTRFLEAILFKY